MRFLVTSCLFGLALAGPSPGFRYAYTIPQASQQQAWSQFNERSGNNYAWGYEFPGRVHHESRDGGGNVRGVIGFVDANGAPNVWKYNSDSKNGFRVDTEIGEHSEAPSLDQTPEEDSTAIFYIAKDGSRSEKFSVNPLLKSALLSKQIYAAGSSPFSKTPQFFVDHQQAEEAGSVSALAERFGAIPVAAVHDVQSRPSQDSLSSYSPLLNFSGDLYTLEVPVQ
ncbi:uncharacterized protein [Macrobrachium rosenbergii]|uniref:uncharacterized protein n=1 Tax=Macrobrachium rosenbergii TaxID=79674 RepID=UPI0034D70800